jgi:hypothetical protein
VFPVNSLRKEIFEQEEQKEGGDQKGEDKDDEELFA